MQIIIKHISTFLLQPLRVLPRTTKELCQDCFTKTKQCHTSIQIDTLCPKTVISNIYNMSSCLGIDIFYSLVIVLCSYNQDI